MRQRGEHRGSSVSKTVELCAQRSCEGALSKKVQCHSYPILKLRLVVFIKPDSVYCIMRGLILLLLVNFSCMKSDHHYVYADGSANRYIITPDTLEYDPVTPEESSTGTYSGGDPKIVSISAERFESISQLFEKALANKAVHIEDRIKTSGVISIVKGDTHTQIILAPGCAEKEAIESLLKQILAE